MKFSLEHRNPVVTGPPIGSAPRHLPAESFSLLTLNDPRILLWASKAAEERIDRGIVALPAALRQRGFRGDVDSGLEVVFAPRRDLLGRARPQSSAVDRGAFERVAFVAPSGNPRARLGNLSVRSRLNPGQTLIAGFATSGGEKALLLRVLGPGLAPFLAGAVADPPLAVFDSGGLRVRENDVWPPSLQPALCEIPAGWMGDKWGARKVLLRVTVLWSIFTAATGWVWNYSSLLVCRLLFGVGEAGCFPNLAKAFTIWLPANERVRAQGLMWFAAHWGGAATPLLVALMLQYVPWRRVFEIFGVLGIVWAIVFYRWFKDDPRTHPSVNEAEHALLPTLKEQSSHAGVPWRKIFRHRSTMLLWLQ